MDNSWKTEGTVLYRMPVSCIVNIIPPPTNLKPQEIRVVLNPAVPPQYGTITATIPPAVNQTLPPGVTIAAFDYTSTVIHSDRGLDILRSNDDWIWYSDSTPETLMESNRNKRVILFLAVQDNSTVKSLEYLVTRTETMLGQLHFAPFIFISMNSLEEAWDAFRRIAEISTITPQSYFVTNTSTVLRGISNNLGVDDVFYPQIRPEPAVYQELVITVGAPNSNLDTYVREVLNTTHALIEGPADIETLRENASNLLDQGYSTVIFLANPRYKDRAPFVSLAIDKQVYSRILWFTAIAGPVTNEVETYANVFQRPSQEHDNTTVIRID